MKLPVVVHPAEEGGSELQKISVYQRKLAVKERKNGDR